MIAKPIELGACCKCSKEPVCSIAKRKREILNQLESIEDINKTSNAFSVTLTCKYYSNHVTERGL